MIRAAAAAAVLAGLVLLSTGTVQRLTSGNEDDDALQLSTSAQVISVDPQRIGAGGQPIVLRVRDEGAAGPVFVGAAREGDVLAYLDGAAWADVTESRAGDLTPRPGGAAADPASADIWVASATGDDAASLTWPGVPGASGTSGVAGAAGTAADWRLVAVGPRGDRALRADLSWRRPRQRRGGLALGLGGALTAAGLVALGLARRGNRRAQRHGELRGRPRGRRRRQPGEQQEEPG